ncbi:MAG: hypothetical protein LRY66_07485, partial [Saccharospirillaceae bacterium]|nr:hypothetical protein [Saccharospirillaceae bacterium]
IIAVGWMKPDAPKREDRKEIPLLAGGQGLAPERRFRLKNSRRLMLPFGVTLCHSKLWDSSGMAGAVFSREKSNASVHAGIWGESKQVSAAPQNNH